MTPTISLISFLLQIWDNYDVDGNGYLDQAELRVGSQMTLVVINHILYCMLSLQKTGAPNDNIVQTT